MSVQHVMYTVDNFQNTYVRFQAVRLVMKDELQTYLIFHGVKYRFYLIVWFKIFLESTN